MNRDKIELLIELERRRIGIKLEKLLFLKRNKLCRSLTTNEKEKFRTIVDDCFEELFSLSRELQTNLKPNIINLNENGTGNETSNGTGNGNRNCPTISETHSHDDDRFAYVNSQNNSLWQFGTF